MNNKVAKLLKGVAYTVYGVGGVIGLFALSRPDMTLMIWISALITGSLILGFSEIIRLFQQLINLSSVNQSNACLTSKDN